MAPDRAKDAAELRFLESHLAARCYP